MPNFVAGYFLGIVVGLVVAYLWRLSTAPAKHW